MKSARDSITRRGLLLGTAAALASPALVRGADKRTIVDGARRKVDVPATVARVFAAGPAAAILLYSLAPDFLLGWPSALRPAEREFVPERYAGLPEVGRLAGRGDDADLRGVQALKPDLILDYGTVDAAHASRIDHVQRRSRIPCLLLDARFERIADSYVLLGEAVDRRPVAEGHAAYVGNLLRAFDRALGRVAPEQRPRVYCGRGPAGLETGLADSIDAEIVARAGAVSVAAGLGPTGTANVSLEQVQGWNPDVVLALDPAFRHRAATDPAWKDVKAVRDRRVFSAPGLPFGWIDSPPAVGRLLGLQWLVHLFHPEIFPDDLGPIVKDFHRRFYHRVPTDAQLHKLLADALPQK